MKRKVIATVEESGIAYLKMDDTEGKNIFTVSFVEDFLSALDELENRKPKIVVLHGLEDVFCGGADKRTLLELCEGRISMTDLTLSERVMSTPFPIIAAMEGHAIGGGLVLALCCEILIAARESRYGAVFMTMGFTPGMGCTQLLQELVGPYVANEMMFTGKRFRGSELAAKATHMNYILPKMDVMPKARDIALQMSEMNAESLYLLKHTLSARKKKLLIDARLQEDLMHRITFSLPETRKTIDQRYID